MATEQVTTFVHRHLLGVKRPDVSARKISMTQSRSQGPELAQTLSRGLEVLEIVAASAHPVSASQVSALCGYSRTVTYRLLRTLEHHQLVSRDGEGLYELGPGVATLAARSTRSLKTKVTPLLRELAEQETVTAFFVVLDGSDCLTFATAIPSGQVASLVQEPGTRHPVSVGAPAAGGVLPSEGGKRIFTSFFFAPFASI